MSRPGSAAIPRDEGPTLLSLRPPQAPVRGTTVGSDHEPGPPPAVRERSEKDGGVKGRAKPVGWGGWAACLTTWRRETRASK